MAKYLTNYNFCVLIVTALLMPYSRSQRPSFAGSRPPNGLNQKDKYHPQPPLNPEIMDRFNGADVLNVINQIPFGQPQTPPVGYPVVLPEPVYTALPPPKSTVNTDIGAPVVFEDRFGDTGTNATSSSGSSSPVSSTTQRPGVPLDAHGDQLLVDQLNQIPIDKRPFWFINYQAIEAQRNGTVTNFAGGQGSRGSFLG